MNPKESAFHEIAGTIQGATEGKLFGKLCYKISGKAFCCFFQDEMVFKLSGDMHAEALNLQGSQLFDPSGKNRPMREWVQVSFEHKESWSLFANAAKNYVKTVTKKRLQ